MLGVLAHAGQAFARLRCARYILCCEKMRCAHFFHSTVYISRAPVALASEDNQILSQ
jgi:hypothetical protein